MSAFSGKNILVVGGSSGIGLELTRRLLAANAGVTVWSRSEPEGLDAGAFSYSTVAVQTGLAFHASIAAAKGEVEAPVRSLAAEFAQKRIRFNAIALSLTDTPLASALLSTEDKRSKLDHRPGADRGRGLFRSQAPVEGRDDRVSAAA